MFRKHDQHGRRVDEDHGYHQLSDAERESADAGAERAGAHQNTGDGDQDQRQELLHGGLREHVERNPSDHRV